MEESPGHEGKCVCVEGQGGRAKHKNRNNPFWIGLSCLGAVPILALEEWARKITCLWYILLGLPREI
jgi:hypothetical protein